MLSPPQAENEAMRLRVINSLGILSDESIPELDELIKQTSISFAVPIALISIVDRDRQFFKSAKGLDISETPRNISFCGHAILHDDIFYVPDTSIDVRFYDNPLVTGKPYIRFYAGAVIRVLEQPIGTLCIIDRQPRSFSTGELNRLRTLADKAQTILCSLLNESGFQEDD